MKRSLPAIVSAFLPFLCLLLAAPSCGAAEANPEAAGESDRARLARRMYAHDFESLRDPDTGRPRLDSADLDRDGWPDFWEPVRAVGYPEYLINRVAIVEDPSGQVAGAYRDLPNHALRISFDGTRVGLFTAYPVAVNPDMAYEFSILEKDQGLKGAIIRAGVEWLKVDEIATVQLRRDEIPNFLPGQVDWPVEPRRILVSDVPAGANAARMFIAIEDDESRPGGAYHGEAWFDNVRLRMLPKIAILPAGTGTASGRGGDSLAVEYHGLADNLPDPNNPGFFRGRRYFRTVEASDVFGIPVPVPDGGARDLESDSSGFGREELAFPSRKYGVYYFTVRLYGADRNVLAEAGRAVARIRPRPAAVEPGVGTVAPVFVLDAGSTPAGVLSRPGRLRDMLLGAGAGRVKFVPWMDSREPAGDGDYFRLLADELKALRFAGIGATAVVKPPAGLFGRKGLLDAVESDSPAMTSLVETAAREIGLHVDSWQWGADNDPSLYRDPEGKKLADLRKALADFAEGLPQAWTVDMTAASERSAAEPYPAEIVNAFFAASDAPFDIWKRSAAVVPWLLAPYLAERGAVYPPAALSRLAPRPPTDVIEEMRQRQRLRQVWVSLSPDTAPSHAPEAAAERIQLERHMRKAIYAAILVPSAIGLGELFDPAGGFVRLGEFLDTGSVENAARPIFLAAGTLSEMLSGSRYLGRLQLLSPFEAHAFQLPGRDEAVIAVWHNNPDGEMRLDRAEIANGLPLSVVDWAGNSEPLPARLGVRRTPVFITGMPASLALTRMSVRIAPDPPLFAKHQRQRQFVEIVNHLPQQAPVRMALRYAARAVDGGMENGWDVQPKEVSANLKSRTPELEPTRIRLTVSPDPNSQTQDGGSDSEDKSAVKLAQLKLAINTARPAEMTLYPEFRLRSELEVEVRRLDRLGDDAFVTLQLRVRWFPTGVSARRPEIRLLPFSMKRGEMKETAPLPLTVRRSPPEDWGKPDAPYEAVEIRIPRRPARRTWVGLTEEGGSSFFLADVSEFMSVPEGDQP